ncbi:DMT family transporter [Myxococcota bacterium]|nr:DMT family transporter [Myxococcota bacterium]
MVAWIAIGFVGVVLVLHPTLDEDQLVWALAALGSGASAAVALVTVRKLGRLGEPPSRTVFYFALTGLVVGLVGSLVGGFTFPDARHAAILGGIGVTATLAQLAVTRAYGYGHTLLAANLSYAGILFASLWGWLVWSDAIDATSWLGIALIITAGASATWLTTTTGAPK